MFKIYTLATPFVCACGRVVLYKQYEDLAQQYIAAVIELESLKAQLRLPLDEEPIYLGEFKALQHPPSPDAF